jgi:hypothetical protein
MSSATPSQVRIVSGGKLRKRYSDPCFGPLFRHLGLGAKPGWKQAFSPDSLATWEADWTMQFARVGK